MLPDIKERRKPHAPVRKNSSISTRAPPLALWWRGSRPSRRRLRSVRSRPLPCGFGGFRPLPFAPVRLASAPALPLSLGGFAIALPPTPRFRALPCAPGAPPSPSVASVRVRRFGSFGGVRSRVTACRGTAPVPSRQFVSATGTASPRMRGRANVPSVSIQSANPATVASNVLGASACLASATGR